jgi:hypothetical protein
VSPGLLDRPKTSNRLSVNLSDEAADAIRAYRERHAGVTVTETIRRAISILKYVDDATENQKARILIAEKGKPLRELVFFR